MVKIDRRTVKNTAKHSSTGINSKTEITIHETGNYDSGANADTHARLQLNGNPRKASWHYQVDDKQAIQSYNEDLILWHSGSSGNRKSIAIEICVNRDGDYNKAVLNAIKLTVDIMKRNKIPLSRVKTHQSYSGKNCPARMLSGYRGWSFSKFKKEVNRLNKNETINQPKTTVSENNIYKMAREVIAGDHGNGHSKRRKSLGVTNAVYKRVRAEVNNLLRKPQKPNYDKLVQETIRGKYGNGNRRKRLLGEHYNEVQRRINNKFR